MQNVSQATRSAVSSIRFRIPLKGDRVRNMEAFE